MPRTVSKSKNISEDRVQERAIRVEKTNYWETVKRVVTSRETRMIVGLLLLLFAIVAALSYVSYLFTGMYDQSILTMDRAERLANREAVRNVLGLPGAMLAQFLIDGSFGFVSILLVFMLTIYALRIMHVLKDIRALLLFCGGSFWVLWGSVVLGFAHGMVHQMGVFRWGGAFGEAASQWLVSYVNTIGTILILGALLVIFLIVTDPAFVPHCKAFGAWCKGIFTRKPREPRDPSTPSDEFPESPEVTIDLPIDESKKDEPQGEDAVTFTIETTDLPEKKEDPKQDGEIVLDIEGHMCIIL